MPAVEPSAGRARAGRRGRAAPASWTGGAVGSPSAHGTAGSRRSRRRRRCGSTRSLLLDLGEQRHELHHPWRGCRCRRRRSARRRARPAASMSRWPGRARRCGRRSSPFEPLADVALVQPGGRRRSAGWWKVAGPPVASKRPTWWPTLSRRAIDASLNTPRSRMANASAASASTSGEIVSGESPTVVMAGSSGQDRTLYGPD